MGAVNRLYRRARFFVRRIVSFDRERVLQFARQSARLSKAPVWWVALDMAWCAVRYETTFENYSEWDFRILRGRERRTYMTDPKSFHLSRKLNDDAQRAIFDDKLEFAGRFGDELGRDWLDVAKTDLVQLEQLRPPVRPRHHEEPRGRRRQRHHDARHRGHPTMSRRSARSSSRRVRRSSKRCSCSIPRWPGCTPAASIRSAW